MHDKPAFPISTGFGSKIENAEGLTRRELFAMGAMQAFIQCNADGFNKGRLALEHGFKTISEASVCAADALIKALEAGDG